MDVDNGEECPWCIIGAPPYDATTFPPLAPITPDDVHAALTSRDAHPAAAPAPTVASHKTTTKHHKKA